MLAYRKSWSYYANTCKFHQIPHHNGFYSLKIIRLTYLICCVGCIHALVVPSGSSLSDVIGPRFWFKSPLGGKLNIRLLLRGPDGGYNFRGHSNSNGGHGDAELKQPGTASSERSFRPLSTTWSQKKILTNCFQHFQDKFQEFRADIQFLITRLFSKTINLCSFRFIVKTSDFSLEFLQIFTKKLSFSNRNYQFSLLPRNANICICLFLHTLSVTNNRFWSKLFEKCLIQTLITRIFKKKTVAPVKMGKTRRKFKFFLKLNKFLEFFWFELFVWLMKIHRIILQLLAMIAWRHGKIISRENAFVPSDWQTPTESADMLLTI